MLENSNSKRIAVEELKNTQFYQVLLYFEAELVVAQTFRIVRSYW